MTARLTLTKTIGQVITSTDLATILNCTQLLLDPFQSQNLFTLWYIPNFVPLCLLIRRIRGFGFAFAFTLPRIVDDDSTSLSGRLSELRR